MTGDVTHVGFLVRGQVAAWHVVNRDVTGEVVLPAQARGIGKAFVALFDLDEYDRAIVSYLESDAGR